jgi:hypothetical protein
VRDDVGRFLPTMAVATLFVVGPIWFAVLYRRGAAGKPGFGPANVVGAVMLFLMGTGLLVWSILAILGIASTKLG